MVDAALRLDDGFAGRADDVYEALIRGHEGLDDRQSADLNARLILVLANQIGDLGTLVAAIRYARESLGPSPDDRTAFPS